MKTKLIYTEKSIQSVKSQEFALKYDFDISPIFTSNDSIEVIENFLILRQLGFHLNELRIINSQLDKSTK